jgi:pimeloyl-ACP methyl ester carboxylesterase
MITFYPAATFIAQELCPPSRVTGTYLAQEGLLPSTFSKMDTLEIKEDKGICEIDVHYLHAESTGTSNGSPTEIDAIYCVHGFGVSSLVWLPVMRRLASDNGARHVLASDLVGWGLTSRPPVNNVGDLNRYGFSFAAGIALALLDRTLLASSNNPSPPNNRSIVLMGLSMGSIVTLRMALAMPGTTQIQIILVAPAVLSFYPLKHNELPRVLQVVIKMLSSLCGMIYVLCMPILLPIRWFVFDPLCYFLLKRVIA